MRALSAGCALSTTRIAVMIFVRLAIGSRRSGLRAHTIWPLRTSNTSPARGGCLKRTCSGLAANRPMPGGGASLLGLMSFARCLSAGEPPTTAAGGVRVSDVLPATSSQATTAKTTTPASGSRKRPRRTRLRRMVPPCSGLFIWRLSERSDHAETDQREDHERHNGTRVHAVLHHQDDGEEREHGDQRERRAQSQSAAGHR